MLGLRPVDREPDADIKIRKQIDPFIVDQDAIGLKTEAHVHRRIGVSPHTCDPFTKALLPEKERLAAMKDDMDTWDPMAASVRRGFGRELLRYSVGHYRRLIAISSVLKIIHVAIAAIQIAAA